MPLSISRWKPVVSTPVSGSRAEIWPGGDVGRGIDGELQRDRQLGEIDVVALDDDLVPGRLRHRFARNVFLAALAKSGRQVRAVYSEAGRQQSPVRRHVGHDRHIVSVDLFEHDHRAFARALQLEHDRSHVEALARPARLIRSTLAGIGLFGLLDKTAQALIVRSACLILRGSVAYFSSYMISSTAQASRKFRIARACDQT